MTEIKLTKRYPQSRTEDTVDAFMRGYEKGKADRPQEWIPCSERLPEIGQKVLASTKKTVFTQVFKGVYRNTDCKRWYWEHNSLKKIEAWQPLPEPWKGADDETD